MQLFYLFGQGHNKKIDPLKVLVQLTYGKDWLSSNWILILNNMY